MADKSAKKVFFSWQGKDKNGRPAQGEIASVSMALAKAELRKQGITSASVRKKRMKISRRKRIKPVDIALLTRQLATMIKAGVPLLQAFEISAEGADNPAMKDLIVTVKNDVAEGINLSEALRKHPLYFDDLFCSLVFAGEQSGSLDTLLDRIATYKEKTEALKSKIRKAMKYPIAVVLIALVVTVVLLVKVVPQFESVFAGFGAELPLFTQLVISISEVVQKWWLIMAALLAAAFVAGKRMLRRSRALRDSMDRFVLKLPVVGMLVNKSAIARFARTLSTTFSAGVPLVEALDSVAGAVGNAVYRQAVVTVKDGVSAGQQLQFSMRSTGVFSTMAVQLVAIGEESGALDDMLGKVATVYEQEVEDAVDGLTSLMEPIIMVVLGVLVGGLIVAMYLPIFQLGSVV